MNYESDVNKEKCESQGDLRKLVYKYNDDEEVVDEVFLCDTNTWIDRKGVQRSKDNKRDVVEVT